MHIRVAAVQSEQADNRGMDVVNMHRMLGGSQAVFDNTGRPLRPRPFATGALTRSFVRIDPNQARVGTPPSRQMALRLNS